MNTNSKVSEYYDQYTTNQKKIGISVRHRLIFKKLKKIGLKRDSNVLEIGCGIGTVSSLIIKHCKKGKFVGVDISPKSIEIASFNFSNNKNATFVCDDMTSFKSNLIFDFIVFPDVLEHIPVHEHENIFKVISELSHSNTKVLINIPEPETLNWVRKYSPEKLQIIDQSLSMQDLLNSCYKYGFKLESMIPYSIHMNENNYLSIVLYRNKNIINYKLKSKITNAIQNLKSKF